MQFSAGLSVDRLVPTIASVLSELCNHRAALEAKSHADHQGVGGIARARLSRFDTQRAPAIPVRDYLVRISQYAGCSPECLVLGMIYIDRLMTLNPSCVVSSFNVHRLLITSVMISAKFFDDEFFNNEHFARVGGVSLGELNLLEVEFLFLSRFNLYVSSEEFGAYMHEVRLHSERTANEAAAALLLAGPPLPHTQPEVAAPPPPPAPPSAPTHPCRAVTPPCDPSGAPASPVSSTVESLEFTTEPPAARAAAPQLSAEPPVRRRAPEPAGGSDMDSSLSPGMSVWSHDAAAPRASLDAPASARVEEEDEDEDEEDEGEEDGCDDHDVAASRASSSSSAPAAATARHSSTSTRMDTSFTPVAPFLVVGSELRDQLPIALSARNRSGAEPAFSFDAGMVLAAPAAALQCVALDGCAQPPSALRQARGRMR